jgi:hypothetical protein
MLLRPEKTYLNSVNSDGDNDGDDGDGGDDTNGGDDGGGAAQAAFHPWASPPRL